MTDKSFVETLEDVSQFRNKKALSSARGAATAIYNARSAAMEHTEARYWHTDNPVAADAADAEKLRQAQDLVEQAIQLLKRVS